MISIRKYLTGGKGEAADAPGESGLYRFCAFALAAIGSRVLTGDDRGPLRARLIELRQLLRPDFSPDDSQPVENLLDAILADHQAMAQQTATDQAIEMQHIVAMLNEALIVLADGRDHSVSRLNKIQESLQRAALIEDIVALKSSLADTVRFVRQESVKAHEAASQQIGRLETEMNQARKSLQNTRVELAGRPDAVSRITASLDNPVPGQSLYVVAYLVEQLRAITQRYGPTVAEELLLRLIKERIQPLAAAPASYRWTPLSILALFPGKPTDLALLRAQVADLNRAQMVHRTALGNRIAVLTVTPSHLVAQGIDGESASLIEQVDKFAGLLA